MSQVGSSGSNREALGRAFRKPTLEPSNCRLESRLLGLLLLLMLLLPPILLPPPLFRCA